MNTSLLQVFAFFYLLGTLSLYTVLAYRQTERDPNGATTTVLVLNLIALISLLIIS